MDCVRILIVIHNKYAENYDYRLNINIPIIYLRINYASNLKWFFSNIFLLFIIYFDV